MPDEAQLRLECVRLAIDAMRSPFPTGGKSVTALAAEIYLFARGDTAPVLQPQPQKSPTVLVA